MIILVSPVIPQDEGYPLFGPRAKPFDDYYPAWYQFNPDYSPCVEPDINVIFYECLASDVQSISQLHDGRLTVAMPPGTSGEKVFAEVESILHDRFYVDFIVHIPRDCFVVLEQLPGVCDCIESFTSAPDMNKAFISKPGQDAGKVKLIECDMAGIKPGINSPCFFIDQNHYSTEKLNADLKQILPATFPGHGDSRVDTLFEQAGGRDSRRMVSIGGWCGPGEVQRMLKLRDFSLPFDYIHSSFEVINRVLEGDEGVFYPCPGETRASLTSFPHHDFLNPETAEAFSRRFFRLKKMLQDDVPMLFVRAVNAPDYREEIEQAKKFTGLLKSRYGRSLDRVVLIFHGQRIGTVQLDPVADDIMCWSAQGRLGWKVPNRQDVFIAYARIILFAWFDDRWPPRTQVRRHQLVNHATRDLHQALYDPMPASIPFIDWPVIGNTGSRCSTEIDSKTAIILCGSPNSGIEALRHMLGRYPGIAIPGVGRDTGCGRPGRCMSIEELINWQVNEMPSSATHWCDYSPANVLYLGEIFGLLGDSVRVLHLVRDGRDVVTSRLPFEPGEKSVTAARWIRNVSAGRQYEEDPRMMTVRIEDLAAEPVRVLQQIIDFTGLDRAVKKPSDSGEVSIENLFPSYARGSWLHTGNEQHVYELLTSRQAVELLDHYGYLQNESTVLSEPGLTRLRSKLGRIRRYLFN